MDAMRMFRPMCVSLSVQKPHLLLMWELYTIGKPLENVYVPLQFSGGLHREQQSGLLACAAPDAGHNPYRRA